MSYEPKRSTFDELVAGLNADERKLLLKNLNQNREQEILIMQSDKEEESGFLDIKFKNEPLLYKLILWIRSVFTKRNSKEIYNNDLIQSLKRKINRNHPGLLDLHTDLIQALFYEKLKEIKGCAEFFKPYISHANEDPGKFYVFLSTFVCPEISEKITADADPYTIPFEREATTELRVSLSKRMENLLKNIEPKTKEKLYSAVRSLIWLKQFSELPFIHFSSQFTAIISSSYTCPFTNAQTDYPAFARVLQSTSPIPKEALESLFLYSQRAALGGRANEDIEKALREFINKAVICFSSIQMFVSSVPVSSLGKVIFGDYEWQAENSGGGEDWFVKFKEEWKKIFESRWNSWLHDRKKNQLAVVLSEHFGLSDFPELREKPWTKLWGGVHFTCEMTAGLLVWYVENLSDEVMGVLNIVILEGVFIKKENRTELSEAINALVDIKQQTLDFIQSMTEDGAVGSIIYKYINDHTHTIKAQQLVSSMILNSETTIRNCAKAFCNSTRTIERIFHGILDDVKDKDYDSLQNLMTIRGVENRAFRDSMESTREKLNLLRSVFVEIEPLDMPKDEK